MVSCQPVPSSPPSLHRSARTYHAGFVGVLLQRPVARPRAAQQPAAVCKVEERENALPTGAESLTRGVAVARKEAERQVLVLNRYETSLRVPAPGPEASPASRSPLEGGRGGTRSCSGSQLPCGQGTPQRPPATPVPAPAAHDRHAGDAKGARGEKLAQTAA